MEMITVMDILFIVFIFIIIAIGFIKHDKDEYEEYYKYKKKKENKSKKLDENVQIPSLEDDSYFKNIVATSNNKSYVPMYDDRGLFIPTTMFYDGMNHIRYLLIPKDVLKDMIKDILSEDK